MGFALVSESRIDPATGVMPPELPALFSYWLHQCHGRSMPSRGDIDPSGFQSNLGRVHLLDVEGPLLFRYRLYGSRVTNPDVRDMTGYTTLDYNDRAFGELVTRHLGDCVRECVPICYDIRAQLDGDPYEYTRLSLPLSGEGRHVAMILVGTARRTVPERVHRDIGSFRKR